MSATLETPLAVQPKRATRRRVRPKSGALTLLAQGEPMIWLTAGALVLAVTMILALVALVVYNALGTFWPERLVLVTTVDGRNILGEVTRGETYAPAVGAFDVLPEADREKARASIGEDGRVRRRLLRTGNYELTNEHFTWISDFEVAQEELPEWAVVLERESWGRFYGTPASLLVDGTPVATEPDEVWSKFEEILPAVRRRFHEAEAMRKHELGRLNARQEEARLAVTLAQADHGAKSAEADAARKTLEEVTADTAKERDEINAEITKLTAENDRYGLALVTTFIPAENRDDPHAKAVEKTIPLASIVRAYPANRLNWTDQAGVYLSRWREFLFDMPREANTEGGVFPAIWGTVVMTLIMSLAVVPFGVLAALYLREYAKAGPIVSAVRIAINNLAGVPSIVFGVFGLGFFCYIIGGFIDGGPKRVGIDPWPSGMWFVMLGLLAACGTGAFLCGIYNLAVRKAEMTRRRKAIAWLAIVLWLSAFALLIALVAHVPTFLFDGFFRAKVIDGNPTYGKGALVWASLTLALLTLPVVIVATEEALSAVPNSMREGSYACGASKWQTIRRIVLPRAMPGIMTGMILAMARGAGEVAPLMLVGAVKIAPELPVDTSFPFIHPDRSFLHLGFQIYDVGFQSQNSEAAIPLVFTTTLLLIALIATLNVFTVWLRARLRRKFVGGQF